MPNSVAIPFLGKEADWASSSLSLSLELACCAVEGLGQVVLLSNSCLLCAGRPHRQAVTVRPGVGPAQRLQAAGVFSEGDAARQAGWKSSPLGTF